MSCIIQPRLLLLSTSTGADFLLTSGFAMSYLVLLRHSVAGESGLELRTVSPYFVNI